MASIEQIKASDGSGNASVATVQSSRSSGASTIIVDTVLSINDSFMGSMGTPHTFIDPITSEEITVISEATAVDFSGHVDGSNLEIDDIAPGYTDAGSEVGDIVIIRPTTQWSDNLAEVLEESHNDDGTLIGTAVRSALVEAPGSDVGWVILGNAPNTVTALGNRSYSCVFNSVDLTSTLSAGMRLRTQRTVAAPTQSTSLNGTTQYYSKTSPAGMTFTNNFVVSAWVKLSSYAGAAIVSRNNSTNGWYFDCTASGQVRLVGFNGSSANFRGLNTQQSIPLNKWVHITAELDMASYTATPTTCYAMIDGVDVPIALFSSGTNPTALVQAGNLEIGSFNGGTAPFPGKIAQVAIYNAKVTEATILASMHQTLSGSETNLISAYSFNNTINDLNTTNANNLTANGSAVATNADSPFGNQADGTISSTLDYGIIQSASFSTNTTLIVQVPEGCTIPTSGGVSTVSYSVNKTPYGMPIQRGKWTLVRIARVSEAQSSPTANTWYNLGTSKLNVPIGSWTLGWEAPIYVALAGAASMFTTLSTANNTESDAALTARIYNNATVNTVISTGRTKRGDVSLAAATDYFMNSKTDVSAAGSINIQANDATSVIFAENAYL